MSLSSMIDTSAVAAVISRCPPARQPDRRMQRRVRSADRLCPRRDHRAQLPFPGRPRHGAGADRRNRHFGARTPPGAGGNPRLKKDGTPFRNAVLVAPIFDDNGELEFFLGSQMEVGSTADAAAPQRRARARDQIDTLSKRQREVLLEMAAGKLTTRSPIRWASANER